jgi:hypothetical protein
MFLATVRRVGLLLAVVPAVSGCPQAVECEDDEVEVDGACVPADTDDTEVDDTEPVDPLEGRDVLDATIRVEWTIERLPNENEVIVECDGRVLYQETAFNTPKTYFYQTTQQPGVRCAVRISDARGGALAAGRVINCSEEVATWPEQRGYDVVVGQFTAEGCVLGCNDPVAENYDEVANLDDGTCEYILGCMDSRALNYDAQATKDDGRCDYGGFGIVEVSITTDTQPVDTYLAVRCDGFDVLSEGNFAIPNRLMSYSVLVDAGFDCQIIVGDEAGDDGPGGTASVCGQRIATWERASALSINPGDALGPYEAVMASFFMPPCSGCTDPTALNYDPTSRVDDGSCQSVAP